MIEDRNVESELLRWIAAGYQRMFYVENVSDRKIKFVMQENLTNVRAVKQIRVYADLDITPRGEVLGKQLTALLQRGLEQWESRYKHLA